MSFNITSLSNPILPEACMLTALPYIPILDTSAAVASCWKEVDKAIQMSSACPFSKIHSGGHEEGKFSIQCLPTEVLKHPARGYIDGREIQESSISTLFSPSLPPNVAQIDLNEKEITYKRCPWSATQLSPLDITDIESNPLALRYASEDMQNDFSFVQSAVKQNGLALQYASEDMRDDESVVQAAVKQNGLALQYASEDMRDDESVVRAAVKQNGLALQYASEKLQNPSIKHSALQQIYSQERPESQKAFLSTQEMLVPNIFIDKIAHSGFVQQVKAGIKTILSTSIGSSVLREIGLRNYSIFVTPFDIDLAIPLSLVRSFNGVGCGSLITLSNENSSLPATVGLNQQELEPSPHVTFFHELVHALHIAQGRFGNLEIVPEGMKDAWTNIEEYRTIAFYENVYRYELGLPLRCSHKIWNTADKFSKSLKASCTSIKNQFRYLVTDH